MRIQVSKRGLEMTPDLEGRIESVADTLRERTEGLELAKFVLEERETGKAVGLVLSWGEKRETVVRHAEAGEWERAFMDLDRRLEKALAEDTD